MSDEPKSYADLRKAMNKHNARADKAEHQVRELAAENARLKAELAKARSGR